MYADGGMHRHSDPALFTELAALYQFRHTLKLKYLICKTAGLKMPKLALFPAVGDYLGKQVDWAETQAV